MTLERLASAPLQGEHPGDDADYLTELVVGDVNSDNTVTVCFSRFGNLCFLYVGDNPVILPAELAEVLKKHGWTIASPDEANQVAVESTGQTVHDLFFNYC